MHIFYGYSYHNGKIYAIYFCKKKIIQIFYLQPLHFAGKEAEIYILGFSCPQLFLIKLHRKCAFFSMVTLETQKA